MKLNCRKIFKTLFYMGSQLKKIYNALGKEQLQSNGKKLPK